MNRLTENIHNFMELILLTAILIILVLPVKLLDRIMYRAIEK